MRLSHLQVALSDSVDSVECIDPAISRDPICACLQRIWSSHGGPVHPEGKDEAL